MDKKPFRPTIRTQTDLEDAWRHLMGPWEFGGPSVWMVVIVDDQPLPVITEITQAEVPPDERGRQSFAVFLDRVSADVGEGSRFAFLRSRPGGSTVTDLDRAWAAAMYDACRTADVTCEVVHLATEGEVRPLPADEVSLPETA